MELKVETQIGELTAVFVKDPNNIGYTAYFREKRNIIVEGDTIPEAIENLQNLLSTVLEYEKESFKQLKEDLKEQSLVMLRLPNDLAYEGRQRHYNTWFRVMFIDNDETFIGKCEKIDTFEFTLYPVGKDVRLNIDKIQHIYKEGEQWCYGDNISICDCTGLCRDK